MSIIAKIGQVYADIGPLVKEGEMKVGQRYKFLTEEQVTNAVRESCIKFGLIIVPCGSELLESGDYTTSNNAVMRWVRIRKTFKVYDPEDDQEITCQAVGEGADVGDKCTGKAETNAMKNGLREMFLITGEDDPDAYPSQPSQGERRKPQQQGADGSPKVSKLKAEEVTLLLEMFGSKIDSDKFIHTVIGTVKEPKDMTLREATLLITAGKELAKQQGGRS